MSADSLDSLGQESLQFRNEIVRAFADAVRSNQPQVPGWVGSFFRAAHDHPLVFLAGACAVVFLGIVITRELICGYLKTNEILDRLRKIEEKLK